MNKLLKVFPVPLCLEGLTPKESSCHRLTLLPLSAPYSPSQHKIDTFDETAYMFSKGVVGHPSLQPIQ